MHVRSAQMPLPKLAGFIKCSLVSDQVVCNDEWRVKGKIGSVHTQPQVNAFASSFGDVLQIYIQAPAERVADIGSLPSELRTASVEQHDSAVPIIYM